MWKTLIYILNKKTKIINSTLMVSSTKLLQLFCLTTLLLRHKMVAHEPNESPVRVRKWMLITSSFPSHGGLTNNRHHPYKW